MGAPLPALFAPDERTARRTLEFFTAAIRSPHTRRAYGRAVAGFAAWCDRALTALMTYTLARVGAAAERMRVEDIYVQRLENADFIAIRTRRREGHTWSAWPLDSVVMSVPAHVSPVRLVSLDPRLLDALVAIARRGDPDWGRWQHALSCFNQGNTDSDAFRYQVEWGLLCSAFERLLDAASDYDDVAAKFAGTMVPSSPLLARDARRRIDRWKDPGASVRFEWLREFYRVRGDFAH